MIEIIVTIERDDETPRDDYDDYTAIRERYIEKGFSEQQAKYFNRSLEPMIKKLGNGNYDCYGVIVKGTVTMPCGHIEEFSDSIGGVYADSWSEIMETVKYYSMVENVLDQMKEKGIDVSHYEIKEVRE